MKILLPLTVFVLFITSCMSNSSKTTDDSKQQATSPAVPDTWESRYDKIEASALPDNVIELIGQQWMLVTAGNKDHFNTMTASWGGIGFLWNKPVVYVFIRPERYTFEFIEKSEYFTLSFLGEENRAIHKICGSKSGKEVDKVKETGLKPVITEKGNILFEQGRLSLECRKLYTDVMKEDCFIDPSVCKQWYGGAHGGLHHIYVAEITGAWMRE